MQFISIFGKNILSLIVLHNKRTKEKNYNNYKTAYYVKQVGDELELRARLSESQKKIDKREALLEPPDRMICGRDFGKFMSVAVIKVGRLCNQEVITYKNK